MATAHVDIRRDEINNFTAESYTNKDVNICKHEDNSIMIISRSNEIIA